MRKNKLIIKKCAGRPTKINEVIVTKLYIAFERGMSDSVACNHAGISRNTFYRHLREDEHFRDKVVQAKNTLALLAGSRLLTILQSGSDRDAAQLIRFTLERLVPELYAKKSEAQINTGVIIKAPFWFQPPTP